MKKSFSAQPLFICLFIYLVLFLLLCFVILLLLSANRMVNSLLWPQMDALVFGLETRHFLLCSVHILDSFLRRAHCRWENDDKQKSTTAYKPKVIWEANRRRLARFDLFSSLRALSTRHATNRSVLQCVGIEKRRQISRNTIY